jgi:hypothetical protein
LFRAAVVRGLLPTELSPCMDRAPLSRPLAPVWLVTGVLERTHWRLIGARFPDVHAYAQLPGSPDTYELPFPHAETHFPVALDPCEWNRSVPPASSTSKPCSPCKSVRKRPELPRAAGRYSLGLVPSEVFSLRAWNPRTRPNPKARTPHRLPKAPAERRKGPRSPSRRVGPPHNTSAERRSRRRLPIQCGPARTVFRRLFSSHGLQRRAHSAPRPTEYCSA